MWFRRKYNIDLFNHELVSETESRVSNLLQVPIAPMDDNILVKLSIEEQKLSGISKSNLLSIYRLENDQLSKFTCLAYSLESKEESNAKNVEVIESHGLSKGFTITYAIYYYLLKHDKQTALGEYLIKRRIPESKYFHARLNGYFQQFEGVMLSDSYIQYAEGYQKENINAEDISRAIRDLQEMDEEHGAFWVSTMTIDNNEFIIQANKEKILTLVQGDIETKYSCSSWLEVEEVFNLQLGKNIEEIISRMKE